ncbi:MAG: hypothetical protein IJG60_01145 [Thermoguttaceae bacterium]|nr:hypothetical protein [Thermoguttaceae bacterium]
MKYSVFFVVISAVFCAFTSMTQAENPEPLSIGSSLQLFVDDWLVGELDHVEVLVHHPERQEIAAEFGDLPWDGDSAGYFTIMYDGDLYHMYYHAWGQNSGEPLSIAYLRSSDGIHWERPNLGLCDFQGNKENNIVMFGLRGYSNHDFNPFVDKKPGVPPEAKYKAIGYLYGGEGKDGLFVFQSADAVHWSEITPGPVFTGHAFDTQNVAFWSEKENRYVLYYRDFRDGIRIIKRAVSDNFTDWTDEGEILFPEGEGPTKETQYYTNQIFPYYRNKDIYIGFPARYTDRGEVPGTWNLPEPEFRKQRMTREPRLGTAVTDSIFIASRDGVHFSQSNDVFVAPGLRTAHNWFYGDNYLAWSLIETPSLTDDMPNELSIYATESYGTGGDSRLRRYTLRIDGFASLHAKSVSGTAATKPLVFEGRNLSLNVATSAAGELLVEIDHPDGTPIEGYAFSDCDVIFGDFLDREVSWNGKSDLGALAGQPVVLRFKMREADLYSLQFKP